MSLDAQFHVPVQLFWISSCVLLVSLLLFMANMCHSSQTYTTTMLMYHTSMCFVEVRVSCMEWNGFSLVQLYHKEFSIENCICFAVFTIRALVLHHMVNFPALAQNIKAPESLIHWSVMASNLPIDSIFSHKIMARKQKGVITSGWVVKWFSALPPSLTKHAAKNDEFPYVLLYC
jgi:hypothetical protein